VGWSQRADGLFTYSLRSAEGGLDVSVIAKRHGGGGHPHAAGFTSAKLLF
jgi:nanoRNase/pAp phosphatase (c-di-AMP/oligoRNAs hydrolase)